MRHGRTDLNNIERRFPHVVDIAVPLGGFGKHLDAMHQWHHAHGIEVHRGRGRREEGQDFIRCCFADPKLAADFAREFGGTAIAV